jgi:organic radical activating enzyme
MHKLPKGIMKNFDPELKRAFDFAAHEVDAAIKNPDRLRFYPGKLKVSGDGAFYTLQGEGQTMGMPAVFLRLKICNLRCVWCDAWYTWNPKSEEFWLEGEDWSIKKTVSKIESLWPSKAAQKRRLVITGGEPLIQRDTIDQLLDQIPDWDVEMETNGTIMPTEKIFSRIQFNCSPKLENSENILTSRFKIPVLKRLNEKPTTRFKFVVMLPADLKEIQKRYVETKIIDPAKIILMPQGVTTDEIEYNMRQVVEAAKKYGFRLLSRLHVEIWGAKRKV